MSNIDKQACQVSRYDLVSGYMQKWPDGEFVYHSDYQELLDELEAKDRRIDEEICRANREHHRGFMMACGHLKEHSNVHYADAAEMEIAALRKRVYELENAEKRIAELEAKLETADKLQDSAFRHGLQHGFSLGQTDNQAGFEECLSAYGTRG